MNKVSVSTLPMDLSNVELELYKVSNADYLHVDVMDGEFVEQETRGVEVFKNVKTRLVKDIHLMIANPDRAVKEFLSWGGIINFHLEAARNPLRLLKLIKEAGLRAGIAINPETPVSSIKPYLDLADQVLVMGVHPGKSGQRFLKKTVAKIRSLRSLRKDLDIEVDGGVNEETAQLCVEAGANVLCSGSYVFSSPDPRVAIDILRNI